VNVYADKHPHFTDTHAICHVRTSACNYQSPITLLSLSVVVILNTRVVHLAARIRPTGRVDSAREAKLDFYNIVEMLTIIQ